MEYCKVNNHKLVKIWYIPEDLPADKIIPEDVTIIGERAFCGIVELTKIIIPGHVKVIEAFAFQGCSGLEELELCQGVERVDYGAFADCTELRSFKYTDGIAFTFFVFHNCPKLTYLDNSHDVARCFYFPTLDSFSITQPSYLDNVNAIGYRVYRGRVASDPFPVGGFDKGRSLYYFVEAKDYKGDSYVYRNKDVKLAIEGAKYFASHKSFSEYFHKKLTKKSAISFSDFAFLTGVCNFGEAIWNHFAKDKKPSEVNYGYVTSIIEKYAPVLLDLWVDAFNRQDQETGYLDFQYLLNNEQTKQIIINVRASEK